MFPKPTTKPDSSAAPDTPAEDSRAGFGQVTAGSHPTDLANVPFQDPESARLSLSRAIQRISPELAAALPALLAESPDPDSALILFDRLVSESSAEIVRLLDQHHSLAHYAIVVFGHSRFLGETLIQNPDLLQSFLRERNLDRSFSREEFHESLARFRSRSSSTTFKAAPESTSSPPRSNACLKFRISSA